MGWTVLYIAFGIVALWLLGEVLFQFKARLRYRLLAFVGFLGVVVGAVLPSVVVIGIGIAAFATGQTFVTLSYRQGFSTGWAIGGRPGSSRRRRTGGGRAADPSLEVSDLQTYAPGTVPVPDPVDDYGNAGYHAENNQPAPEYQGYGAAEETQAYAYGDLQTPHQDPSFQEPSPYQDASLQAPAHYQAEPQQYAAYADPYLGYDHQGEPAPVPAAAQQQQPSYDYGYGDYGSGDHLNGGYGNGDFNGGNFNNGYGGGDYPAGSDDGYGGYGYPTQGQPPQQQPSYYTDYADVPETPPGGVWVPQQRDAGATPPPPPEQPPVPYGYSDETYQQYPQGYYNDRHGTY
ncbi:MULTISPECIES: hypothetical protein [unclassified Streptomyces]|uniref:hypothetical protein n=1 Tax=unclassified Streptomyces TaxID=2593676 RepID=UPI002DD92639|nr:MULTISPECIES: hypothetical protein [unclassified Streptomyces]WSA95311.1 hypothetical protein OIE63_29975 [Streptomyces sp. NBC_01795]WSB79730.1 hypothetical protein OHB04_31085 [Streptomyces sp. NBC_01775]WSS12064.1 hypothetical protein OG533_09125 [Streptomyces sp. NBC_01186]WSS40778.1 hypothetical protein OG220_09285 [Streptomyces sp. NBC_01187]